jgi:hypothetical protein
MTMNAAHTDNLSEPIKISLRHPTIASGPTAAAEANAREWMRAYEESVAKLERVLQSYGLRRTGNDDLTLSLRLAIDLHPGFKVVDVNAPKPYQHRRGNPVTLMMLIADVETVKREKLPRACSDSEAVRILASSQRFASRWDEPDAADLALGRSRQTAARDDRSVRVGARAASRKLKTAKS